MRKNARLLSWVLFTGLVASGAVAGCGSKSSTAPTTTATTATTTTPATATAPQPGDDATPPKPRGLPPVEIAADPPAAGDIGTAQTIWVIAAAPNGSWVLVCDARKDTDKDGSIGTRFGHHGELYGDDPAPYLVKGAGSGEELEAVAGVDPQFRYIAVAKRTALEILDTQTGKSVVLKRADLKYESGAFGGARVAFDPDGKYVLYTRTANRVSTIVVHRLADGAEHEIATGKGKLQEAKIAGSYVELDVYDPKPNQAFATVGRSGPDHTVGGRRCRVDRPIPPSNGEARYALLAAAGTAKPVKDAIVVGTGLVVSADDGTLSMQRDGQSLPIADAACSGRVVARSHEAGSVLYQCTKNAARNEPIDVHLWKTGVSKALGIKSEIGSGHPLSDRIVIAGDHIIDMVSGRTFPTKNYYGVAAHGAKVLLHEREKQFAIADMDSGAWVVLPSTPPDSMVSAQRGRIFAAGRRGDDMPMGLAVDLDAFAELGTFQGEALAVSESGWILARERGKPLRWVRPMQKR